MLFRPGGRARSISHATGSVFSHVANTLCRVAQSPSRAFDRIAEDVAKAADYECVLCQLSWSPCVKDKQGRWYSGRCMVVTVECRGMSLWRYKENRTEQDDAAIRCQAQTKKGRGRIGKAHQRYQLCSWHLLHLFPLHQSRHRQRLEKSSAQRSLYVAKGGEYYFQICPCWSKWV